jgi:hypothetical protein
MADPVSLAINAALIAANMALTASQQFEGPRLDELRVTTADYGTPISYVHGLRRLDGLSCIWAEDLREVKRRRKTKGGKFNDYTYYGTWAVLVCDHAADAVTRIWFDRNLVYDATGAGPVSSFPTGDSAGGLVGDVIDQLGIGDISQYMSICLGADDQEPDPRMAATVDAEFGSGSTPAYRGVTTIVFKDLPLEKLGNRLPQVSVEVATSAADAFPFEERETAHQPAMDGPWGLTWSPDRTRLYFGPSGGPYEIWDARARSLMVAGEFSDTKGTFRHSQLQFGITSDGYIYALVGNLSGMKLARYEPDGFGAPIIMGETELDPGEFGRGSYCVVLPDVTGVEYVLIASWSGEAGGYKLVHGTTAVVPQYLNTFTSTGYSWQIKSFFRDAYGGLWAVGGLEDLADNQLALWNFVAGSGGNFQTFGIIDMPTNQSGVFEGCAFHHLSDSADHFVIGWDAAGGNRLAIVDPVTMTLTSVITAGSPEVFRAVEPGADNFWLGETQYDASDLSVIRTVDWGDWGVVGNPNGTFDVLNRAFIVANDDDTIAWLYLDRVDSDGVTLRSIVENITLRSRVDPDDVDATDLTQTVPGYSWTQGQGKAILEPLLEAYDSEVRPHDFGIQFLRRGSAVLGSIPVTSMGAGGSIRHETATTLDTDLPLKVNLTFADLDRDQQPNTAMAQRSSAASDGRRELSVDATTLAVDADTARVMAEGVLRRAWMKAQTAKTALTRAWTKLEPGDAYTLELDDVERAFKLTRLEFGANGVLTTEWERYAPRVHQATSLLGAPADGMEPDAVVVFGYTKGLFLDIPLVRDIDDALIGYMAATPYSEVTWPGATFYRSDDGVDYDEELGSVASTQAATIGAALSALPDALATVWDNASAVTVKLFSGELTSATKAEVANGANRALLGDEIIGFTTATLVAEKTYQISGLHRGRRGTEWATGTHASGDRFVLLDSLPQAAMSASDVGDTFYARATTNGGPDGFPQLLEPFTGASLKPYAPAHLAVVDDGGDLVVTWTRRTRIGGVWRDFQDVPLGEGSEAYLGRIIDAGGNIIRSYTGLTSPTFTYTAAEQAADGSPVGVEVHVCQISQTVGNGFFAEAAL